MSKAPDAIDKIVAYAGSTSKADKITKSIGYGFAFLARVIELYAKKPTRHSQGLSAVAGQIAYARYVTRFTGVFECLEALKNGSWVSAGDDEHLKKIVTLQVYSMLLYYPLEHASFVGFVAPKWIPMDAGKLSRQSCMAWGAYVALDMYAIHKRLEMLNEQERQLSGKQVEGLSDDEHAARHAAIDNKRWNLHVNQLRNMLFLPLCIHWSTEQGIMPEVVTQFLAFSEAVIGTWHTWPQ
ncbi:Aste57867_25403 [Aphanomyces stellatus]|uniref:Aste57867_25403 protein n=1 Tax=Aphanomyces stellatus TaxID=120398 RepID=A0A485LUE2_9STRA|nr:hypothetical protein As57867_025324 [Aphanomyces stellatus]VFU02027.1 Aste57867_25403 [Aphanomyces stellatus]